MMNHCYICGEGVAEIAVDAGAYALHRGGLNDSAKRLLQSRKLQRSAVRLPVAMRDVAQCQSCITQFGGRAAILDVDATAVIGEYHQLCNPKGGAFLDAISAILSPQEVPPASPSLFVSNADECIWSLYQTAITVWKPTGGDVDGGSEVVVLPQVHLTAWKMRSLLSLRYPSVRLEPTTSKGERTTNSLRLVAQSLIEQGAIIDLSSVPTARYNERGNERSQGIVSNIIVNPATPLSSYMTHSCTPNTQLLGVQPTERSIGKLSNHREGESSPSSYLASVVIALRDISSNEPLTIDTEGLPPYFRMSSISVRQEELLRRRTIRKAMHMDSGYHFNTTDDDGYHPKKTGICQCEACVGDVLLPELLDQQHQNHKAIGVVGSSRSSAARLRTTPFQRVLIKEGVVAVSPLCSASAQQTLSSTILEKMVCGNVLRYDFSRSFVCPLSPLCKDGVVYPSAVALSLSGVSTSNTAPYDGEVWRCDSCLEWWVVKKNVSHSTLSPTIRSIVRFEEQAIGKAKEALSTIKMLHSGYVPIADVLPLLDSSTQPIDVEEVRRRAMASLHYMEEMGIKPLTNKCYTALKDLLQACVDAGMVMEVTPRESSFDNLVDRTSASASDTLTEQGNPKSAKDVPHVQSRCSHWIYSSACLYMSLYFSELGTRRLKGEGEQEAALSYAVRWMKLYLRSMIPLSWVDGDQKKDECGGSSLLWNRTKVAAGGVAMTLARAIRRFPRQYANAKYLTILAYVSGYTTTKMALGKCISSGHGTIIHADTVEFIKSHNAIQIPEIKEIETLVSSSIVTTRAETIKHAVSSTERKGQVWHWLHHGETGFGSQDESSTSATGGGAESHEEALKDWDEYLVELSREAMTRQQNPNLPPEVVQAMRGLGR